jgi:hypothetical protein
MDYPGRFIFSRRHASRFADGPRMGKGDVLKDFHRAWYKPNNAVVVIVGAIDPDHTLSMVR